MIIILVHRSKIKPTDVLHNISLHRVALFSIVSTLFCYFPLAFNLNSIITYVDNKILQVNLHVNQYHRNTASALPIRTYVRQF